MYDPVTLSCSRRSFVVSKSSLAIAAEAKSISCFALPLAEERPSEIVAADSETGSIDAEAAVSQRWWMK